MTLGSNVAFAVPQFSVENYHKRLMRSCLKSLGLWEFIDQDKQVPPLRANPTIAQIKQHEEENMKREKDVTCLHSALTDDVFTSIMHLEPRPILKSIQPLLCSSRRRPLFSHRNPGPQSLQLPCLGKSYGRALGGKNKYEFVDGSIDIPDTFHPSYKAWGKCNMLIHSWIMNSVSESIAQSIVFIENSIDVWKELKERFSQGDLIRISELQCEIYGFRQGSLTINEFFLELKVLWEELESYMPAPVCGYPHRCTCIIGMRSATNQHNRNRTIRFLTGLNDNFSGVTSQILSLDPHPSLNLIFSMVIQHDWQNCNYVDESKVLINVVKPQGRGRGGFSQGSYGRNS